MRTGTTGWREEWGAACVCTSQLQKKQFAREVVALASCDSGDGVVGEVLNRPGHGDHIKDNGDDSGAQQCIGDQGYQPCQGGQEEQDQQGERVQPLLQPQAASPAAKTSLSSQMLHFFFLTFCISPEFVKSICEPNILTIQNNLLPKWKVGGGWRKVYEAPICDLIM